MCAPPCWNTGKVPEIKVASRNQVRDRLRFRTGTRDSASASKSPLVSRAPLADCSVRLAAEAFDMWRLDWRFGPPRMRRLGPTTTSTYGTSGRNGAGFLPNRNPKDAWIG